jgi:hypothetical protein
VLDVNVSRFPFTFLILQLTFFSMHLSSTAPSGNPLRSSLNWSSMIPSPTMNCPRLPRDGISAISTIKAFHTRPTPQEQQLDTTPIRRFFVNIETWSSCYCYYCWKWRQYGQDQCKYPIPYESENFVVELTTRCRFSCRPRFHGPGGHLPYAIWYLYPLRRPQPPYSPSGNRQTGLG